MSSNISDIEIKSLEDDISKLNIIDKDGIFEYCVNYFKIERMNIDFEKKLHKNISIAFKNIGLFGEVLTSLLFPNSIGTASKAGCSFDNVELDNNKKITKAREVKTCCFIQPKQCIKCLKKCPFFQEICIYCNSKVFNYKKDSRFNIDCKAQFEYNNIIEEYICILIDYDNENNILLKVYKIFSNNVYFQKYLINQLNNSTSKVCNLIPYSYDFYMSAPIILLDFSINCDGIVTENIFNMLNNQICKIPIEIFNKKEITEYNIDKIEIYVCYEAISDKIKVRDKNLNKNRGEISRLN